MNELMDGWTDGRMDRWVIDIRARSVWSFNEGQDYPYNMGQILNIRTHHLRNYKVQV